MLHYIGPSGKSWTQQNSVYGTFDWKPVRFARRVPDDVAEAWLFVGLESVSGKASRAARRGSSIPA